ncbi:MAG: hypothetical protein M1816_007162 [Peltula sp. TS41687]|nr:MAG: hypothetical protein M1816_007162 [Peltula sp. TS41687]
MSTAAEIKARKKAKPSSRRDRVSGSHQPESSTQAIPWEEIFKRHASILEGHQRMLELVQKHTVADTEEWKIVTEMLKRMDTMNEQVQDASRIFDHKQQKKSGKRVDAKTAATAAEVNGTGMGSTSKKEDKAAAVEPDNPYFVIDTNPTPVNIPPLGGGMASHKRTLDEPGRAEEATADAPASKKVKVKPAVEPEVKPKPPTVEFEDISAEVDARMKEKEEKRKNKDKKKRKRESGGYSAVLESMVQRNTQEAEVEPPKQKKVKKSKSGGDGEGDKKEKELKSDTKKTEAKVEQQEGEKANDAPKREIKKPKKRSKDAHAAEKADLTKDGSSTKADDEQKKNGVTEEPATKDKVKNSKHKRPLESDSARAGDAELPIRNVSVGGNEDVAGGAGGEKKAEGGEGTAEIPNKRRKKNKDKA